MNIVKRILTKLAQLIRFTPATKEERLAYSLRQSDYINYSNDTIINPATGLPMIGCLDVNGNSFGSNSSYEHHRINSETNYQSPTFMNYSSCYDPFNNRF